MRRVYSLAVALALAAGLGSCQLFGGGNDVAEEPLPPVTDAPADAAGTAADRAEAQADEALPPVIETAGSVTLGELIQSTDADSRVSALQSGDRTDPFADVTIAPPPPPEPAEPVATNPPPTVGAGGNQNPGGGPTAPPTLPSGPNTGPDNTLPPIASPDLAIAVVVTGVVEVGSEVYAIISTPDDGPSRRVREGQYISNGQVLVKRIEIRRNGEPLVILEQNGIEVARRVGEGATEDTTA